MSVEIDEEVTFNRRSLHEITNNLRTPPKFVVKDHHLAWKSNDNKFPPSIEGNDSNIGISNSESPLFKKTPPNKGDNSSPMSACSESDDDNDVTVAINLDNMSLTHMHQKASFQVAKYSEAEMLAVKEEWDSDKQSLEEAMQIADQLMERAIKAENEKNISIEKYKNEILIIKTELTKEKDEHSIEKTQMRALSHTLQALENELKCINGKNIILINNKDIECKLIIDNLTKKMETDKMNLNKKHNDLLKVSVEKTDLIQKELERQQIEHEKAITTTKERVYAKVKGTLDKGNQEYSLMKSSKEELERDLNKYQKQLKLLQEKIKNFEENNKLNDKEHSNAILKLQNTINESKIKIEKNEKTLNIKEKSIEELKTKLLSTKESINKIQTENTTIKNELEEMKRERDNQNIAIAKLATSNTTFEIAIESIKNELEEEKNRNISLRQMNEEMMGMLENVHGV